MRFVNLLIRHRKENIDYMITYILYVVSKEYDIRRTRIFLKQIIDFDVTGIRFLVDDVMILQTSNYGYNIPDQ